MFFVPVRFLCFIASLILFPIRAQGRGHVPVRGGFILACNHVSYLDPVVFGVACPRPLSFMARDTLFRNPIFGGFLSSVNVFPVKRASADIGAIKEALRCLKKGQGVLLFPEGTRGKGTEVGEGSTGVAFLARKARVPVVPAFVDGTERVLPRGAKMFRPSVVRVIFGEPISPEEKKWASDREMTADVMKRIASLEEQIPKSRPSENGSQSGPGRAIGRN